MKTTRLRLFLLLAAIALLSARAAIAATITVNSTADPAGYNNGILIPQLGATVTLRDAIVAVRNTGGTHTITFDPSLAGKTIYLSQQDPSSINVALVPHQGGGPAKNLTLQGLTGNNGVTIARDPNVPILALFTCVGSDLTMTVNDLTFSGGDTLGWGFGGAFDIIETNVSMNRCTFTGNRATKGGAIFERDSTFSLTNCTIAGNHVSEEGGGLYLFGGTVTVTHTTITDNSARFGAGILTDLTNPLLVNTIVAGNRVSVQYPDIDYPGGKPGVSPASHHNLIGDASSAGGLSNGVNNNIVGANPLLNVLAFNGGPTLTAALSAGSPGLNAAASGSSNADQRGVSRPQGAGADIGAYELVDGAPTTFTSFASAAFAVGVSNSFSVTANGAPAPSFSISGALPAGVTFTPAGLLSGTPASGTEGTYPLVITASNAAGSTTQSFTLTVITGVVVTTATDEDNGSTNPALGTGTSLREAVNYANTQSVPQTITFSASLAGQSIDLTITGSTNSGASALLIQKDITIRGLTGNSGVTIRRAASGSLRPFMVAFDATLTLNDLTVADGLASTGGGILNFGTLRMNRCTLRNNTATFSGGGLNSGGGSGQAATLINCTIANNQTGFSGGGITNEASSTMTLTNVTVTANSTTSSNNNAAGGGINNQGGTLIAINSIIAGNTKPNGASDAGGTALHASGHHNLIGTGGGLANGVNGNIVGVQNAKLGTLAANGGPTQTIALQSGSPAVNAAAVAGSITSDQRGVSRPKFGAPDIGSYELDDAINESLVVTTVIDEFNYTSDPAYGTGTSLREAISAAQSSTGAVTITFAPSLAGQTVTLSYAWDNANSYNSTSAFRIDGNITIAGPTSAPGVTLKVADTAQFRHFVISSGGTLTLRNLTLTGGKPTLSGFDFGGAIWNFGSLTVRNCTFTGNTAGSEGGAIQSWGHSPLLAIDNSTFSGNHSNGIAGAIDCGAASMTFRHVTIANNSATNGHTLVIWGYPLTMINSIIAGNTNEGVASANDGTFSGTSTNNILSGATAPGLTNGTNANQLGVPVSQLMFGSFGKNGGPTATVPLQAGSVAIDAGVVISGLTSDQRGRLRNAGAPDVGAFEFIPNAGSLIVTTAQEENDGTSDPLLGAGTSLREALVYAQSLGGPRTITFAPALAGQTITLSTGWTNAADESALRIGGEITLHGLTTSPGVTITMAAGVEKRHITVDGGGKLDVSNLTFTNGRVGAGGNGSGGSIESNGALAIRNCTFTGNSTLWDGGAVLASYGSPSLLIENSTFSGNSSTYNANAISTGATQSILRFVTATNNTGGDAVILLDDISVTIVNSILDGNAPDTIYNVNRGFGGRFNSQTSTNNIFGASFVPGLTNGQNGNRSGVPVSQLKLAALANNGGPTATVALQLGSLAIDSGVAIPGVTADQRGIARPNGSAPDVGAFELVQTQAAIPIVSPLGGAYENSVQVSIANTNLNATVRYTLDGSTPTSSNGQIYTAPFTLTKNATVKAIAYGGGWLDSPIASVGYTVLPPLPFWRNLHGLPADGSQDGATPARDGVANLLKFAFNLAPNAGDLSRPNVTILPPNGTAGLPRVMRDSEGRLVIEFVRRKAATDSGIAYIVETSGDLLEWAPLSLTSASVTSIDNVWERVSVTDPVVAAKRFGRVRVGEVVPYFNDFNAAVGAASLRGHAAWTNQAVRLTDTVADQLSAVVLNGITLGSHISGFRARFNLQLGPTTTSQPADGASFAVGNLGSGGWGERGPNTAHHIAVGFDTYPGSGNESIGVHVWVNGAHIAANAANPYTNGASVPVEISYDASSGLSVRFNGTTLFNGVAISGFSFLSIDQFGIGARTGGANERAVVDDVEIALR